MVNLANWLKMWQFHAIQTTKGPTCVIRQSFFILDVEPRGLMCALPLAVLKFYQRCILQAWLNMGELKWGDDPHRFDQ